MKLARWQTVDAARTVLRASVLLSIMKVLDESSKSDSSGDSGLQPPVQTVSAPFWVFSMKLDETKMSFPGASFDSFRLQDYMRLMLAEDKSVFLEHENSPLDHLVIGLKRPWGHAGLVCCHLHPAQRSSRSPAYNVSFRGHRTRTFSWSGSALELLS